MSQPIPTRPIDEVIKETLDKEVEKYDQLQAESIKQSEQARETSKQLLLSDRRCLALRSTLIEVYGWTIDTATQSIHKTK